MATGVPAPHPPPPEATIGDMHMSIVMLGAVAFAMAMLYLLQSSNPTLRTGGWLAVSRALSCYMGVCVNMTMFGNVVYFLGAKPPVVPPDTKTVVLDGLLFLFWWTAKSTATAWAAGLFCFERKNENQEDDSPIKSIKSTSTVNVEDRSTLESCAWLMESYGVVLGFASGSSAMQFFASLQQMGRGTQHENTFVLGVMPCGLIFMMVLYRIMSLMRLWLSEGDGQLDDAEVAWSTYMDFAENKVVGLALSHVMVQAVRFYMQDGHYPGVMGQQLPGYTPKTADAIGLLAVGVGFAILSILSAWLPVSKLGRVKQWIKMSTTLAIAWCFLYSSNWIIAEFFKQSPWTHVCQTSAVTVVGAIFMLVLSALADYFERQEIEGYKYAHGAALVVHDLFVPAAVLIGFSWRDAWQSALQVVVAFAAIPKMPPPVEMLLAAFLMLSVVYPAWRRFILPMTFVKWVKRDPKELMNQPGERLISDALEPQFALPPWLSNELRMKRALWAARTQAGSRRLVGALFEEGQSWVTDLTSVSEPLLSCTAQGARALATMGDSMVHNASISSLRSGHSAPESHGEEDIEKVVPDQTLATRPQETEVAISNIEDAKGISTIMSRLDSCHQKLLDIDRRTRDLQVTLGLPITSATAPRSPEKRPRQ